MRAVIVRSSEAGCEPACPDWMQIEGEIRAGSAAEVHKALKQAGKRKLPVLIRSPGGCIDAALEIGRAIRKKGLPVAVAYTVCKDSAPHDKSCKLPKEQKGVYRGMASDVLALCTFACTISGLAWPGVCLLRQCRRRAERRPRLHVTASRRERS